MKRITSKRKSNFGWTGGTIRPGQSAVVPDEVADALEPSEWDIVAGATTPDEQVLSQGKLAPDDTEKSAPKAETRPAKRSRTRKG